MPFDPFPKGDQGGNGLRSILFIALAIVGLVTRGVGAADVKYCATFNTGDGFQQGEQWTRSVISSRHSADTLIVVNIYQSNGACSDTCRSNYAFAVLQGDTCWCSDYAPSSSAEAGSCNEDCPGYPADKCGDSQNGLYGYIALRKSPSGTRGDAASSPSTVSPLHPF